MKKSAQGMISTWKTLGETIIFLVFLFFFWKYLPRPIMPSTIIVISSLGVVFSILLYLKGNYFESALFSVDVVALVSAIFILLHSINNVTFIVIWGVFLLLSGIYISERDENRVLIFRNLKGVINLLVSFILVFFVFILMINFK